MRFRFLAEALTMFECRNDQHPNGAYHPTAPMTRPWQIAERFRQWWRRRYFGCGCPIDPAMDIVNWIDYPGRRFDVLGADGRLYLTRWTVWTWRGWSLRVHKFRRPDEDSCLHDHPWAFWTFIVWGGYVEEVGVGRPIGWRITRHRRPGRLLRRSDRFAHRITELPAGIAWTVVLMAPKTRSWGFHTRDGWKPWREFLASPHRVLWCRDEPDRQTQPPPPHHE